MITTLTSNPSNAYILTTTSGTTDTTLIAAAVATLDIMNGASDVKSWMSGALIGKWSMDNLTNNAAGIHLGTDILTFIKLPDGSFASPPGATTYNLYFSGYRNIEEDSAGHQTIYYFDEQKHLLGVENALGQKNIKNHDGQGHVVSETDARSNSIGYHYDGNNNLTQITDPFGKQTVNNYDRDSDHARQRQPRQPGNQQDLHGAGHHLYLRRHRANDLAHQSGRGNNIICLRQARPAYRQHRSTDQKHNPHLL